jgi:hypothetical protein
MPLWTPSRALLVPWNDDDPDTERDARLVGNRGDLIKVIYHDVSTC